jgi:hypothetical protein
LERSGHFPAVTDPVGNDVPGQGTVITATNGRPTLNGFYATGKRAEHDLLAYPR